jgi:CRISPR/Cas system CSM-associated protein Csm2 small subunit
MKRPKLNDLTIDRAATRNLRAQLKKNKNIKITINVDAGTLASIRTRGGKTLFPYYQFLGQLLKKNSDDTAISRLDRIERELKKIKRQIAA